MQCFSLWFLRIRVPGDVGGLCSPGSSPRVRRASVTLRDFPVACRPPSWGSRRPRRVLYFYSLCSATFTVTRLRAPPSAPSHGPMRTASSPPEHGRAQLLCRRPPPPAPRPLPPGIRPVAESPSLAARPHPQGPRKSRVAPQGLHGTGLPPPPVGPAPVPGHAATASRVGLAPSVGVGG